MLKITTSQIFDEIAVALNLSEGGERQLKEILMQLDQHIVIDDFKENELERRSNEKRCNRESQAF